MHFFDSWRAILESALTLTGLRFPDAITRAFSEWTPCGFIEWLVFGVFTQPSFGKKRLWLVEVTTVVQNGIRRSAYNCLCQMQINERIPRPRCNDHRCMLRGSGPLVGYCLASVDADEELQVREIFAVGDFQIHTLLEMEG
jgi:hypothetical protein